MTLQDFHFQHFAQSKAKEYKPYKVTFISGKDFNWVAKQ